MDKSSSIQRENRPIGDVSLVATRDLGVLRPAPTSWFLKNWLQHRRRSAGQLAGARMLGQVFGVTVGRAELRGQVARVDWSRLLPEQAEKLRQLMRDNVMPLAELPRYFRGVSVLDYGVLSNRVVTTAGVGYIVDAFQNLVELEEMKYHAFGTGTNAEASGDTALQTEETTQYATDNIRPTGTTTEGASANIYRTVATYSPDSGGTRAITEHGVLSDADVGQGVLLDRSVFSAVNLVAGQDSLQSTYELTLTAGS